MYCRDCGKRMRWASAVRPPDQVAYIVQVYECATCDVVEIENEAPPPFIEEVVEAALADGSGRRSRIVYSAPSSLAKA
jgi:hypothetical protein